MHSPVQVMVLESLSITSTSTDALSQSPRMQSDVVDGLQSFVAALDAFQVNDLYDHFDINICDLEVRYVLMFRFYDWSCLSNHMYVLTCASCADEAHENSSFPRTPPCGEIIFNYQVCVLYNSGGVNFEAIGGIKI